MAGLAGEAGRVGKKVADPAFFAEFEIAVFFGEPHPNHLKARLGADEYEDLIAFLRASKWFEERLRVRDREDWTDRTLAQLRHIAGIGLRLKQPPSLDDCLPARLRSEKKTPADKAKARAEAEAKIRAEVARRKALKK